MRVSEKPFTLQQLFLAASSKSLLSIERQPTPFLLLFSFYYASDSCIDFGENIMVGYH